MTNTPNITQELVNRSCDNAIENDYALFVWAPEEIAADMADYDSDFEGVSTDVLIPFIQEWFRIHDRVPPVADQRIVDGHDH